MTDRKPRFGVRFALLLTVWMSTAAMTSCQIAASSQQSSSSAASKPVPKIQIKNNPSARQRHELTFKFQALPGTISKLEASADFEVQNIDCVPVDYEKAIGGVRLAPRHKLPLTYRQIDENTYTATLIPDALLNEDYYGLGVCEWGLSSATVHFYSPTTHFIGGLTAEQLQAGAQVVEHYLTQDFSKKPDHMEAVFGEKEGTYVSSAGPQFTMSISIREETL
jgi:hypothetical protein